jgi:hypothetical protein
MRVRDLIKIDAMNESTAVKLISKCSAKDALQKRL